MEPVDLFYSYAHEDEPLRDELAGHLKIMERRGVIRQWHDRSITPGQRWDDEIRQQLRTADLILLLISKDFINSDFIWGHELDTAMNRQRSGEASVVPVMLRAVDITGAPFADLQGLPTDLRPVTSWPNRDEAWTDVAIGIRRTVEQIRASRKAQPGAEPAAAAPTEGAAERELETDEPTLFTAHAPETMPAATAGAAPELASDPLLARVVGEFTAQVEEAAKARGATAIDAAQTEHVALSLIDAPDQKRVLWVDDNPSWNRREAAALAKLQIQVIAVTSTDAALDRIDQDPEPFDLVLSDWSRPEDTQGAPSAGIRLLRTLRSRHHRMPVIYYHGSFDEIERSARHNLALSEGAYGEAVMPNELLDLVVGSIGLS